MIKILSFCEEKIPSVVLGVNNIFEYISDKINVEFTFKETRKVKSKDIINADIIICVRGATDFDKDIVKLSKLYNRLIIYYLDDDLFNIPKYSSVSPFYESIHIRENMTSMMKDSDILWTSNFNIKKKYSSYFDRSYVIDIPINIHKFQKKDLKENIKSDNSLTKICFAGSVDHVYMIDNMLAPAINSIAEKYTNRVCIYIIGVKPKKIKQYSNIKIIEYFDDIQEYYEFVRKNEIDIGLAPLGESNFNSCKYYNKFLDYTCNGMVGVYSDVEPYKIIVNHEFNGMLAKNEINSWLEIIEKLILSKELRNKIYNNAMKIVEEKFSYEYIMSEVLKCIPEIEKKREIEIKNRSWYLEKKIDISKNYFIMRIINGFSVFGIKYLWIGGKKVPYKTLNYLRRKLNYAKKK